MDDFESFKASREKMDPTSRKMSEQQWKQAYVAHCHARGRVSGRGVSESKAKTVKKRRKSSAGRGMHRPSNVSELGQLRHVVREQSAYADLRLIVDILSWIAVGLVILVGVVSIFFYTSVPASLVAILSAVVKVIVIVLARLLIQVLIDIPDIALYREIQDSGIRPKPTLDPES